MKSPYLASRNQASRASRAESAAGVVVKTDAAGCCAASGTAPPRLAKMNAAAVPVRTIAVPKRVIDALKRLRGRGEAILAGRTGPGKPAPELTPSSLPPDQK